MLVVSVFSARSLARNGCAGQPEATEAWGDSASPSLVIDVVTPRGLRKPSDQALLLAMAHRFPPAVDLELGEDAFGVGAQGVDRDKELPGDLRSAQ